MIDAEIRASGRDPTKEAVIALKSED